MYSVPSQFQGTIGRGPDRMQCVITVLMSDRWGYLQLTSLKYTPGGIHIYPKLMRGLFAPKIGGYNLKIDGRPLKNNPRIDIYLGV